MRLRGPRRVVVAGQRAFLVHELEGVSHWSGVPRSINGAVERASAALAPASTRSGLQVEEINPAWLKQGVNQVAFGVPRTERGVSESGDPVPYTRQTFTYEDPTPSGVSVQAKPDPIVGSFFPAETHRTTEWFEGEATAQKSTEERRTWSFDHGGLDTLILSADEGDADDLFYKVEYDTRGFSCSSPDELYLARPDRVVARSGSASGAVLRDRRATYHPTTGALATFSHHVTRGGIPGSTATYNDAASTVTIERDEFGNIHKVTDPNAYELTYVYL